MPKRHYTREVPNIHLGNVRELRGQPENKVNGLTARENIEPAARDRAMKALGLLPMSTMRSAPALKRGETDCALDGVQGRPRLRDAVVVRS